MSTLQILSNKESTTRKLGLQTQQTVQLLDFLIFNYFHNIQQNCTTNFFLVDKKSFNGLEFKHSLNSLVRNCILAFNRKHNSYSLTNDFKIVLDWMLQNSNTEVNYNSLHSALKNSFSGFSLSLENLKSMVPVLSTSNYFNKKVSLSKPVVMTFVPQTTYSYTLGWKIFKQDDPDLIKQFSYVVPTITSDQILKILILDLIKQGQYAALVTPNKDYLLECLFPHYPKGDAKLKRKLMRDLNRELLKLERLSYIARAVTKFSKSKPNIILLIHNIEIHHTFTASILIESLNTNVRLSRYHDSFVPQVLDDLQRIGLVREVEASNPTQYYRLPWN